MLLTSSVRRVRGQGEMRMVAAVLGAGVCVGSWGARTPHAASWCAARWTALCTSADNPERGQLRAGQYQS